MYNQDGLLFGGEIEPFTEGWVTSDGANVRLPDTVASKADGPVILHNTLPSTLPEGAVLTICSTYQSTEVLIDGVSIYAWSLENKALFIRPFGLPCYLIAIPASAASKPIELRLRPSAAGDSISIYSIQLGDGVATTVSFVGDHIDTLILFFILTALFILFTVLVFLYRKQMSGYSKDAAILSAFIALATTWMITDSPLSLLFSRNIVTIYYASAFAQMLMPAPMVLFIRRFVHRGRQLLNGLAALVFINFFICIGLLLFGVADIIQTLFTTHILQLLSCVAGVTLCIIEILRFKRREAIEIFAGYSLLCLFGGTSVIIFSINGNPSSSMFVRIGITAFVLILGFGVVRRGISELAKSKSYRSITLSIPCGICQLSDLETGGIIYANSSYYKMFGYTESSAKKAGFTTSNFTVLASDLPLLRDKIKENAMDRLVTFEAEARHKTKNGETIWILSRYTVDPNDKGTITAVMIDITDRKQTEEKLRISEEEYRITTRHSNKRIIRYDIRTKTGYGQQEDGSHFGLPPYLEDIPESVIAAGIVAPDSISAHRAFYDAIFRGEREGSAVVSMLEKASGEFKWYHFDFTTIFDDEGKPAQAIISFYDITLQRQKELAFRRWQQSYDAIPKSATNYYEYNLTNDVFEHSEGAMLPPIPEHIPGKLSDVAAYIAKKYIFRADVKNWLDFMCRDRFMEGYTCGRHSEKIEFRRLTNDTPMWTSLNVQLIPDPYSSTVKAYFLLEDIDEQKKAEILLQERSTLDSLTGLLNRGAFIEKFNAILKGSSAEAEHAFIMLDIDNFKTINDTLGHNIGDALLERIAGMLKYSLRADDLCGRLGGDEFVICLKNMSLGRTLEARINDISALIYDETTWSVPVSASFGISGFPCDGRTFDELYQKADIALYKVKARGRGGFAVYDPQLSFDDLSVPNKHL